MPSALAIETHALERSFGSTRAVAGVDLAVPLGGVYGFLGPNGAGKTTTIRMLATLLPPDGGRATVLGHDVVREAAAVRARVGLTGQFASVDEDLTGRENLVLIARLLGLPRREARQRTAELLDAFGLTDAAGRQARVNPITHLVTSARALTAGEPPGQALVWSLLVCAVLVGVFGPLTMRLYRIRH